MPTDTKVATPETSSLVDDYARCEECIHSRHTYHTDACKTCDGSSNFEKFNLPSKN